MRFCSCAAAAVFLAASVAAQADTLTTYQVENQAGKKSLGTVTIDSTLGTITNLDLTVPATVGTESFDSAPATSAYSLFLSEFISTFSAGGYTLQFDLPVETLVGYQPNDARGCATAAYLCDYLANVYAGKPSSAGPIGTFEGNLVAGAATSVTPEPSSIALLGTGLLGTAGFVRRRRA